MLPQQTVSGIPGGGELSLYQYFTASPLFAGFNDFSGVDRKLFLTDYTNMSVALKNYLSSTETATNISTLGLDYQLDDSQISHIATAIRELILGKIFIKDFPMTISSRLGIDDIKAGEIANNIISKSFGPIIEDLKRIQRIKFPDKITQMQKEAQPPTLTRPSARPDLPLQPAKPAGPNLEVQLPNKPDIAAPISVRPAPLQTPSLPPKPAQIESQRPPSFQNPSSQKPKMEFKVPDLSGIKNEDSLEKELEKVANVIDLRARPKNQTDNK